MEERVEAKREWGWKGRRRRVLVGSVEPAASAIAVRMTRDRSFGLKGGRTREEPVHGAENGASAPKRQSAGWKEE
jgi:hypothetical protein